MNVPVFKTRDVVDALQSAVDRALDRERKPIGDELAVGLRKQFPGISDDQLRRTFAVFCEETRERHQESIQAFEQAEEFSLLAGSIFEGLPEGTTLEEAAKMKAAKEGVR